MSLCLLPELDSGPSPPKASQACINCRKQKKCDKALSSCGLCTRMGRQCDYTETPNAPTASDLAALQSRLSELENRLSAAAAHQAPPPPAAVFTAPPPPTPGPAPGPGPGMVTAPNNNNNNFTTSTTDSRGSPPWVPSPIQTNNFPSAVFLDIDCFKWAGLSIPQPNMGVPPEVVEILSHGNAVQDAAAQYFDGVHRWFPIISRKRMTLGIALWEGGPDLAMLFLAMKLITAFPHHGSGGVESCGMNGNPVYAASKRFLGLLEASGNVSLLHLQAMVLVTLYEFGHGIYPAAWMSVAACARYADMIGIPSFKESSVVLGSVTTWTEYEERKRVWWAIYILDRAMCLGNKKRFIMPEPEENFVLPVDDDAWDDGDPGRALSHSISTPLHQPQGRFARLAQAGMLISETMTHCRDTIHAHRKGGGSTGTDLPRLRAIADKINSFGSILQQESTLSQHQQQQQLPQHNTPSPFSINSFSSTSTSSSPSASGNTPSTSSGSPSGVTTGPSGSLNTTGLTADSYFNLLAPRFLVYSTQILLLDIYCCPENLRDGPGPDGVDNLSATTSTPEEHTLQIEAIRAIRQASLSVRDLGVELLDAAMLPSAVARVSPLCLDAMYGAMATLHWLWKEAGQEEIGTALEDVRRCLSRLEMRWRLAGGYLALVQHHDMTTAMAARVANNANAGR